MQVDKLILLGLTSAEMPKLALKEHGHPPELRTQQWPSALPALQDFSVPHLTVTCRGSAPGSMQTCLDLHQDPQPAAASHSEHTLKCQSAASTLALLLYVRYRQSVSLLLALNPVVYVV